jgi:hypothetical protein
MTPALNDPIGAADKLLLARGAARSVLDSIGIVGRCYVELFDENGDLKDLRDETNLITTAGFTAIVERLDSSPTTSQPTHMAIGTGSTAPAAGNTALVAEIDRNALTSSVSAVNVLTMIGNWAAGDGTNAAIAEAGVLNAVSTGTLYSRATFTAINKGASDTLQITWTYTFS